MRSVAGGPVRRLLGLHLQQLVDDARRILFTGPGRASVLDKTGQQRRWFYRFRNPLLQPFVILTGLAHEKVEEAVVATMQQQAGSTAAPGTPGPRV